MLFQTRCHWCPKDLASEREYEDAFHADAESGRLAVSDGVASGVFSRSWAQLLALAATSAPPDPSDPTAVAAWLEKPRADWIGQIDFNKLPWNLKAKFQQVGAGYATLLWVQLSQTRDDGSGFFYRAIAIGDCCLFHLRDGQVIESFPMTSSEQFDLDPASIGSVASGQDSLIEFQVHEAECREGDILALTTDAIAQWVLRRCEAGEGVDWETFWRTEPAEWTDLIDRMRRDEEIRVDDTTLVMARVGVFASEETSLDAGRGDCESIATDPISDESTPNESILNASAQSDREQVADNESPPSLEPVEEPAIIAESLEELTDEGPGDGEAKSSRPGRVRQWLNSLKAPASDD